MYRLSKKEKMQYGLTGFLAGSLFLYFFYQTVYVIGMAIPCAFLYCKWKGKELGEKRRRRLELQFRDWIDSASGHLQAGCSVENAFVKSGRELTYLYDSAADIHREIRSMEHLLANNIPLEKILYDFGERSQAENIQNFADVFATGKRSGGNLREMISDTCEITAMKTDVEREIQTMIHGKVMEQKIMCFIPFGIILYISLSSPGYFSSLYHNPAGICMMTACLLFYLFSLWISLRIIRIEV